MFLIFRRARLSIRGVPVRHTGRSQRRTRRQPPIALTAAQFEELANAFLAEIEAKFR
jgi:hypothetical protein